MVRAWGRGEDPEWPEPEDPPGEDEEPLRFQPGEQCAREFRDPTPELDEANIDMTFSFYSLRCDSLRCLRRPPRHGGGGVRKRRRLGAGDRRQALDAQALVAALGLRTV